MSKIKISKEDQKQLWEGIEKFFLNHSNEFIQKAFKLNRHDDNFKNTLIAAAVEIIFIAKIAAYSIKYAFNWQLIIREAVNRGRIDNSLESELKIHMVDNIIGDKVAKQQLDVILSTNVRGSNNQINSIKNTSKDYTEKEIRKFNDIVAQFKRDYIMIFEQKEYMNNEHIPLAAKYKEK